MTGNTPKSESRGIEYLENDTASLAERNDVVAVGVSSLIAGTDLGPLLALDKEGSFQVGRSQYTREAPTDT